MLVIKNRELCTGHTSNMARCKRKAPDSDYVLVVKSEKDSSTDDDFTPIACGKFTRRNFKRTVFNPNDMGTWSLKKFLAYCETHRIDHKEKPYSMYIRRIRNRESAAAARRNARNKVSHLEAEIKALSDRLSYYNDMLTQEKEKNDALQKHLDRISRQPCPIKTELDEEGSPIILAYGSSSSNECEEPESPHLPSLFDVLVHQSED